MNNNEEFVQKNRDYLIKQSEMLQTIIGRMASNSLTIKQLGLTIWTTLIGFGFANKNRSLFLLALLSLVLLGFLDTYYLLLEKRFRKNFNQLTELICGFSFDQDQINRIKGNYLLLEKLKPAQTMRLYLDALSSRANLLYVIVLISTLVIWVIS